MFPTGNRIGLDVGEEKADSWFGIYSAEIIKAKQLGMVLLSGMRERETLDSRLNRENKNWRLIRKS